MAVLKVVNPLSAVLWDGTNTTEVMQAVGMGCVVVSDDGETLVIENTSEEVQATILQGQYAVSATPVPSAYDETAFESIYYVLS